MSGTGVGEGGKLWCEGGTGSYVCGRCKEAVLAGDTGTSWVVWAIGLRHQRIGQETKLRLKRWL